MQRIRAFISYSSKDKYFAGDIRNSLEKCVGFEPFLAHDDLNPSDDWPQEILNNLENTDFVIPLVSQNSIHSGFVNQEIGFALGARKKIIPISIDGSDPHALIYNRHAHKCREWDHDQIVDTAIKIFFLPIQHPGFKEYQEKAMDSIVYALEQSGSFKSTSNILHIITETNKVAQFNKTQVQKMIAAARGNSNIYDTSFLYPKFVAFLKNYYGVEL